MLPRVLNRESAKVIAFKLGNLPVRTVQNWQRGINSPSQAHWIALRDLFPELRDKDMEWMAETLGVDPLDETRLFQELQMFLLRRRQMMEGGK